jgi:hypothetical protein
VEVVQAINPLSIEVNKILRKMNALRNALAHSFFPENRKEYKATGKVLYSHLETKSPSGIQKFWTTARLFTSICMTALA